MAQQEGVLCEEVLLLSETNEDVCVKVKVHARVMGEVTLPALLIRLWCHFFRLYKQFTLQHITVWKWPFVNFWGTESVYPPMHVLLLAGLSKVGP